MPPGPSGASVPDRLEASESGSACAVTDLAGARRKLLSEDAHELDAAQLRQAVLELHESWLTAKATEIGITPDSGYAIVGIGGLGRRELLPYSDLDLVLVHDGKPAEQLGQVADRLWYPLWDANIRLDHSVRTVSEALGIANTDMTAALGMLEARHIAGEERLSAELIDGIRRQWRSGIRSRMDELVDMTHARWLRLGRIAHRAEPDLKSGRGGLRDVQLLNALAIAQLIDRRGMSNPDVPAGSLDDAYLTLLDVRTELHRASRRGRDQLLAQFADEISAALDVGDRFALARLLSGAGRTIAYHAVTGLRTAANALLAREAQPQHDPGLVLRVAAASADSGVPIGAATLSRLADSAPPLPTPWPREALDDLLVVLLAGPTAVTTIEALDRTGLWGQLLPEWGAIRDLPPRDVSHKWTVDRHVVETAVHAAPLTTQVARPDLLALGALLHDIGKGRGTDHCVLGADLVIPVAERLGLPPQDVDTLSAMVRHHLLLPVTAIRSDLNDPKVIESVSEALGGDPQLLELLRALSEADSKATGPGVWSDWKSSLVDELVRRCRKLMAGEPLPKAEPTAPHYLSLADDHGVHVEIRPGDGERLHAVMVAPDERGLVSKAAAVLALNSLRVHSASVNIHEGVAITEFVVSPLFGSPPAADLLRQSFVGALKGGDVLGTLEKRDSDATSSATARAGEVQVGVPVTRSTAPPRILWLDNDVPDQMLLEVRAMDRIGLLALLARALERAGADMVWAKVNTFGSTAADVFCVTVPDGYGAAELPEKGPVGARVAVEKELLAVLGAPAVVLLDEPVGD
jgi:[protein-PII] uridylyltransferase